MKLSSLWLCLKTKFLSRKTCHNSQRKKKNVSFLVWSHLCVTFKGQKMRFCFLFPNFFLTRLKLEKLALDLRRPSKVLLSSTPKAEEQLFFLTKKLNFSAFSPRSTLLCLLMRKTALPVYLFVLQFNSMWEW